MYTRYFFTLLAMFISSSALWASPILGESAGGYWHSFIKWWGNLLGSQSGVVMTALAVGAISLFIITRGKWRK
jgi:hypothetical protein